MNTINNESPKTAPSLGRALHSARIAAPFTIGEVAIQLNLNITTVIDLELELPNTIENKKYAAIYLRGYLSNYARLVGLDNLEQYPEYKQLSIPEKSTAHVTKMASVSSQPKKRNKFIAPATIATCVLIASGFVINQFMSSDNKLVVDSSEVEETINLTSETSTDIATSIPTVKHDLVVNEAEETPPQLEQPDPEPTQEEQQVQPEVITEVEPSEKVSETPATTEQVTQTEQVEQVEQNIVSKIEVVDEEINTNDQVINLDSINLNFSGDSWTEVFDAKGERLAYGLYQVGHALTLNGYAPFKLKLGDPSVVEIHYQDEKIETVFPAGRTARLTVPG